MKKVITIKEIAKICGCSIATVNRALHDRPDINPDTKERIKIIARENGYRPHFMARSLVRGKTNIIGLIVLDIQNPFFGQLTDYLNRELQQKGYSLHLGIMDGTPESEYRVLEQLACMKVDGIIHFPLNVGKDYVRYLKQLHIPLIHLCNWLDDDFPCIGVRERDATVKAVNYIKESGYDELVYVSPPLRYRGNRNLYTLEERLIGAEKSAATMLSHVITNKNYIRESIDIIQSTEKRCAILCSSDIFALDIMSEMRVRSLNAPQDYGIMGFDNISILNYIQPRLSTIAYPIEELAEKALEALLKLIGGESPQMYTLDAELLPGNTI